MTTGGLSKARLDRMHDVLAGYVERGDVSGIVTAVSRRDEAHVDAIGLLGMTDTAFAVPEAKRERLAACYQADAATGGLVRREEDRFAVQSSGSAGLFSTVDDCLAFGQMMLNGGRRGTRRILARPTVEVMTTDQITPAHKAASPFFPGFWDNRGWGFGVSMITRRDGVAAVPGRYGWDGGFGTSWSSDPHEEMVAVLMVQRLFDPMVVALNADFLTLAYQAIDD